MYIETSMMYLIMSNNFDNEESEELGSEQFWESGLLVGNSSRLHQPSSNSFQPIPLSNNAGPSNEGYMQQGFETSNLYGWQLPGQPAAAQWEPSQGRLSSSAFETARIRPELQRAEHDRPREESKAPPAYAMNVGDGMKKPAAAAAAAIPEDKRSYGQNKAKRELPADFTPTPWTVQLGRGRCSDSIGNRRMRLIVNTHIKEYSEATEKLEKGFIVSRVVKTIREACPVGAFVKYEHGKWIDVGERAAREKVGAAFRDALHSQYKSSSKSKVAKRKEREAAEAAERQGHSEKTKKDSV